MPTDPNLPRTLPQLLDWIKRYADTIYVREQSVDGRWKSVALSSLPAKRALFHSFRWIREGIIPVRLRGEDETESAGTD